MNTFKKFFLTRWTLLVYSSIALGITVAYIVLFGQFNWVNWEKYYNDSNYYNQAQNILKEGAVSIKGNLWSLQSPLLIGLLLFGAFLSIIMFIIAWKSFRARTYTPLLSLIGFLAPLLVHGSGNIFWVLFMGYVFVMMGAVFSVFSLKFLR